MRFLFISNRYMEEEYHTVRDEVIAQWNIENKKYIFKVYCPLTCKESKYTSEQRYHIFKKHMPNALRVIIGGDKQYISAREVLLAAKIQVYYIYSEGHYILESWGLVSEYK